MHHSGNVTEPEMLRTFNCGIGLILVVPFESKNEVLSMLQNFDGIEIGRVEARVKSNKQVI